jgi:hypothetical protein
MSRFVGGSRSEVVTKAALMCSPFYSLRRCEENNLNEEKGAKTFI